MNDLMTKSFLNYVELKKQARKDLEAELQDIEKGQLNPLEEQNLSQFYQEVEEVKSEMEEITNLLFDLQTLNEESKSSHSTKIIKGLRDRMDSDIITVLRKAKIVKARLESLDKSNSNNRKISYVLTQGSVVDRTRISITNGLRIKMKEMMIDFQSLREKIVTDHKEELKRKYFFIKGEVPNEELIEKMVSGGLKVELFEGKSEEDKESKVRHEAVLDIQRSLSKLHQLFLDMAIVVETQGEKIDDIEENVAIAGKFVSGGTNSLYYANQMKKKKKKRWVYWVIALVMIILLVCVISMLAS